MNRTFLNGISMGFMKSFLSCLKIWGERSLAQLGRAKPKETGSLIAPIIADKTPRICASCGCSSCFEPAAVKLDEDTNGSDRDLAQNSAQFVKVHRFRKVEIEP